METSLTRASVVRDQVGFTSTSQASNVRGATVRRRWPASAYRTSPVLVAHRMPPAETAVAWATSRAGWEATSRGGSGAGRGEGEGGVGGGAREGRGVGGGGVQGEAGGRHDGGDAGSVELLGPRCGADDSAAEVGQPAGGDDLLRRPGGGIHPARHPAMRG